MRRTFLSALPILLVACSSGGDDAAASLAAYLDATDALHEVVDGHVQAVKGASDLDAVGAMHADYAADFEHAMEDLTHAMEDIEGCDMGTESMGMMDESWTHMGDMETDVAAHTALHDEHEDVADCHAEADAHESAMDERIDALVEHHGHWSDDEGLACGMHDDDEMGGHDDDDDMGAHDD